MAVTKTIHSTSFTIEVQKGVDKSGDAIYGNKTFNGLKADASPENVLAVAEAIKGVLNGRSRNCFINESSTLANA